MRKRQFTLIEIMIVVAIIALLALIALPNFMQARKSARTTTCVANLKQIEGAKQTWAIQTNQVEDAAPNASALDPYFTGSVSNIECPLQTKGGGMAGHYTIGNMSTLVVCNQAATGDSSHTIGN